MSSRIGFIMLALTCSATLAACKVKTTEDPRCGDGKMQPGEDCDGTDFGGGTCLSFDFYGGELACTEDCTLEISSCVAAGSCGDGILQAAFGESCDEDQLGGQTCETQGRAGGVLACTQDCSFDTSGCATCGDGVIMEPFETCEGDDLQGASCLTLGYYGGTLACSDQTCTLDTSNCETYGRCGDSVIQASQEACDGANLNGTDCTSEGYYEGTPVCSPGCTFDWSPCYQYGRCGDNLMQGYRGEQCDGTDFGGATCRTLRHWSGNIACNGQCNVTGCLDIEQITTGLTHTCALISDGTVRCWGGNQFGQLGDGTTTNRSTPVTVTGLSDIKQIEAGDNHTCAVSNNNGLVYCWGSNMSGQLGDGTTFSRSVPTQVPSLLNVLEVASGGVFTCVLHGNRQVSCWGANNAGQLGDGTTAARSTPAPVTNLDSVTQISAGAAHACAIQSGVTLWCWGNNNVGQLGDNSSIQRNAPVQISSTMSSVSAGGTHTCGRNSANQAFCWGSNAGGQLGLGDNNPRFVPTQIMSISNATQVAAGSQHTCARLLDESVLCWGSNYSGQLGNGSTTNSGIPVAVTGLTTVDTISVSEASCAVSLFGEAFCWGANLQGQLGDGTLVNRSSPTLLAE